ncbi:hypothetical protein PEC301619_07330 [Pectobacterium carotovorum subsp. carotovorum]|nr:hypothetical protein PEC301619_07330 [Pectobacterium carotovorum subsp. carotovorum]
MRDMSRGEVKKEKTITIVTRCSPDIFLACQDRRGDLSGKLSFFIRSSPSMDLNAAIGTALERIPLTYEHLREAMHIQREAWGFDSSNITNKINK